MRCSREDCPTSKNLLNLFCNSFSTKIYYLKFNNRTRETPISSQHDGNNFNNNTIF